LNSAGYKPEEIALSSGKWGESLERHYFGNPVPNISCGIGEYERRALKEASEVAKTILQSAGAFDIKAGNLRYASHQIGTHRMGKDSISSVVDENLCAHDVSNLYLVGSGSFVTSSPSPPTLTIAALATKTSEHIHIASLQRSGGTG